MKDLGELYTKIETGKHTFWELLQFQFWFAAVMLWTLPGALLRKLFRKKD